MNTSRGLAPADVARLDALVRHSNAALHTAIADFIAGGHRDINAALRNTLPPDDTVRRFLDQLGLMADYAGTSYRVSSITRTGLAALQRGHARQFADLGAQCAFVLPGNAAAWALHASPAIHYDDLCELYSIFDESVPQKNLSTRLLADLVVVPPDTALRVKALRFVASAAPADDGRRRVIAHFAHDARFTAGAQADPQGAARYDLFSGARHR